MKARVTFRRDRSGYSAAPGLRSFGEAGYLLVWMAAALALFGLLGGWHGLLLTASMRATRAYDVWLQGNAEERRMEQAVVEGALADGETGTEGKKPAESVLQHLRRLDGGGARLSVTSAPASWNWTNPFPESGANPGPLLAASPAVESLAPAELRRWLGNRMEANGPVVITTSSERLVQGQQQVFQYETECMLLSVPLSRFGLAAYEMPEHLGISNAAVPASSPRSELPAGLVPARDAAARGDWLPGNGTMAYHHRRRASIAAAYRRLFSASTIERLASLAGATHYHDLEQNDSAATASLDGLTRTFDGAFWDLGAAGHGHFGSEERSNSVALVVAPTQGRRLVLADHTGNPDASPLLLVLFGPPGQTGASLEVHLDTILRPVMIVGVRIRLGATQDAVVRGAVFLDPESSLAESTGGWNVAHLSYPAAKAGPGIERIATQVALPTALEAWIPRARFVAAVTRRRNP